METFPCIILFIFIQIKRPKNREWDGMNYGSLRASARRVFPGTRTGNCSANCCRDSSKGDVCTLPGNVPDRGIFLTGSSSANLESHGGNHQFYALPRARGRQLRFSCHFSFKCINHTPLRRTFCMYI